ncbi:MAG: hypothetical protein IKC35_00875 [Clostridia bacterium]|nr:hypothetical protein [Clostridia bacterium]
MKIAEAVRRNGAFATLKAEAKSPTHSYMIVSPDTVTAELFAQYFISFLTGKGVEQVEELKDVYYLPQGEKVLISDADFITQLAHVMPTELEKKYFIVKCAETANESAQNKLLKTLEEAPETAVIILLCANEYVMLPTVRSRCRTIRPQLYDDQTLYDVLDDEFGDVDNRSFAVAMANGSLSGLVEAVTSGVEPFDIALSVLMQMRKSSEILPFATKLIQKKEKLISIIAALELILRDCMVAAVRPELIRLKDSVMDIRELARSYTADVVIRVMPKLSHARRRINAGGNVNSIVDEMLFSILEEKAKCQK